VIPWSDLAYSLVPNGHTLDYQRPPSGGPYTAPTWSALHPGEVDYTSSTTQTISSAAGNLAISRAIDPIAGDGACATVSSADQRAGVATYRLPASTGNGCPRRRRSSR
jgi:hypothetical protein